MVHWTPALRVHTAERRILNASHTYTLTIYLNRSFWRPHLLSGIKFVIVNIL